jgi:hypothetical protein
MLFTFWIFYPYKPIAIHKISILNLDKKVLAGDYIVYQMDYTKYVDLDGAMTRKLVNEFIIDLTDTITTNPVGTGVNRMIIPIPKYADPGKYKLRFTITYKVNPIRSVTIDAESEEFIVTEYPILKKNYELNCTK